MSNEKLLERHEFRQKALKRDNNTCIVPWCSEEADEVHHIIERSLWTDEGYYMGNAASVCNPHHKMAENNHIPPQAFWRWINENPVTPEDLSQDINKWGEEFETPPHQDLREYIKYPSTRHLPFSNWGDKDDTFFRTLDNFINKPLVILVKMDGGNATLVKDTDNPVRARNGKYAEHKSFDLLKKRYWDEDWFNRIPENLQVCGEWLYAKHSIHYGGTCEPECEDVGPELNDYFQIFGVFDTKYNTWLSWPEVEKWSKKLGVPTVPVLKKSVSFTKTNVLWNELLKLSRETVNKGHEGIVVRSKAPYHYGQFSKNVGKYVRENHVKTGEKHWSKRDIVTNKTRDK